MKISTVVPKSQLYMYRHFDESAYVPNSLFFGLSAIIFSEKT